MRAARSSARRSSRRSPELAQSAQVQGRWRNRIVRTGAEAPDQIAANPRNWRIHSALQQGVLEGVLSEVGWVSPVIVNARTGYLVDGHARVLLALKQNEPEVPVAYVDLTDEEEALVLATFDPVSAMAGKDTEQLNRLLEDAATDDHYVAELLNQLQRSADAKPNDGKTDRADTDGPPAMELQPFERYDYVVLLFRHSQDWERACELFDLGRVAFEYASVTADKRGRKIGFGRVVDGAKALERLCRS